MFLSTNVVLRQVFAVIVCFSSYKVAHWKYLQLKNPNFFLFGIVA